MLSFSKFPLEPVFLRANLEINESEYSLFYIYQPRGMLPPLSSGNGCDFFVETYGIFFFLFGLND